MNYTHITNRPPQTPEQAEAHQQAIHQEATTTINHATQTTTNTLHHLLAQRDEAQRIADELATITQRNAKTLATINTQTHQLKLAPTTPLLQQAKKLLPHIKATSPDRHHQHHPGPDRLEAINQDLTRHYRQARAAARTTRGENS